MIDSLFVSALSKILIYVQNIHIQEVKEKRMYFVRNWKSSPQERIAPAGNGHLKFVSGEKND